MSMSIYMDKITSHFAEAGMQEGPISHFTLYLCFRDGIMQQL